jgi:hypothetical protein
MLDAGCLPAVHGHSQDGLDAISHTHRLTFPDVYAPGIHHSAFSKGQPDVKSYSILIGNITIGNPNLKSLFCMENSVWLCSNCDMKNFLVNTSCPPKKVELGT